MSRKLIYSLLVAIIAIASLATAYAQASSPIKHEIVGAGQKVHVHVRQAADVEDTHSRRVIERIVDRVGKEHRSMLHKLDRVLTSIKSGGRVKFDRAAELAMDQEEEAREKKQMVKRNLKSKLQAAIKSGDKAAVMRAWGVIQNRASGRTLRRILMRAMEKAGTPEERKALQNALERAEEKIIHEDASKKKQQEALKKANTADASKQVEKLLEAMKKPEADNGGVIMHGKKCKKTQKNSWPIEEDEYGGKMTKAAYRELVASHEQVDGMLQANPRLTIVEKTLRNSVGTIKQAHDQHVWLRGDALPEWAEETLVPEEIQDQMAGRWQEAVNIEPF